MPSILLDTNVLIYAYDAADIPRQSQALAILRRMEESAQACLSVQCLSEFMRVMIVKRRLSLNEAIEQVGRWQQVFQIYPLTTWVVIEAARGVRDYGMAYYDAQIWAAARLNQAQVVFSEDFQDGRTIEGVRFVNPFSPHFDLNQWN